MQESFNAQLYLLRDRLRGLQSMVKERFVTARAAGTKANVTALSSTIRKVKRDILQLTVQLQRRQYGHKEEVG